MLTRLVLYPMAKIALNNGAQAYLIKSQVSGDDLNTAIQKSVAAVAGRTI